MKNLKNVSIENQYKKDPLFNIVTQTNAQSSHCHQYTGIQLEDNLDRSNEDNLDHCIQPTSLSILQFPCHNSIHTQNNQKNISH